ncbi:TetR/AcrR family transcriptional regulator [Caenispirillum salinarum]|uniref:TetR/AcrR family transcriptional regulator n=1 Tax=Caenispirillum salinarum TaxID=859058 RepID=UPI00384CE1A3
MKSNKSGNREETQALILSAAEQVFAEFGYKGATTGRIAELAGVPKANLHYYFKTKENLYHQVLEDIVNTWFAAAAEFDSIEDPEEAISHYVRLKLRLSRERPLGSKVFANEIIHGAPNLIGYLRTTLKDWTDAKARVIEQWIAQGRIRPVDPHHLLVMIWATTQTYADFGVQVAAVLGKQDLDDADFETAAETLTRIILRGLLADAD